MNDLKHKIILFIVSCSDSNNNNFNNNMFKFCYDYINYY